MGELGKGGGEWRELEIGRERRGEERVRERREPEEEGGMGEK